MALRHKLRTKVCKDDYSKDKLEKDKPINEPRETLKDITKNKKYKKKQEEPLSYNP